MIDLEFSGQVFQWRGPAPYFYVAVPDDESDEIHEVAGAVTYGWGVVPVQVVLGATRWETSLFPKDGRYLVPLKTAVRKAEAIDDGDLVRVSLSLGWGGSA